ncbi:nucleotide exchange factor GrpE [Synechocystis sp. PCC 7339]|uniref:nucleotide exchange factor GrpE n=1 Tax=unclassified Synechocystis TaxID=2640012 RepID=UPI001BAFE5A6|nr:MULTISPECIES: nucleotide exchange factor GrpE [unclassified Synechocystis]QUS60684.1 nucleotide exchange factor GrpE [Synechocystis sp. PCC 7338]UAJ72869.1 nucleotide exchange factor GrpE [Synechocystis sp. PCC 7339]
MNEDQVSLENQTNPVSPEAGDIPTAPPEETPQPTDAVLEGQSGEQSESPEIDVEAGPAGDEVEEEKSSEEIIAILQKDLASHRQELAEQSEQLDSVKKRYVALAAEFDNFRKRTQREKEEQAKIIKGRTITELLPVVDNFERARTQIKPNSDGENLIHKSYQGVYKNLVDSLKSLGVAPMRPEGKSFDPKYHEAMLREPTAEYPEDTVIEELVRGYLLDDIVLRHSMVKVAVAPEEGVESGEEDTNS